MIVRDREHMFDPTPERPWTPVFGIDGTSISAKRSFSHDGISLGPCYDTVTGRRMDTLDTMDTCT